MPLKRLTLATAAAALTVAVLLVAGYASPQPQTSGVAPFREQQISHTDTGDYPGATEVWRTRILLLHRQQTVGTGGIACIHLDARVRECYGTYTLPTGRIKILGEITNRTSYQLAIVGGTGAYLNATGVAVFTNQTLVTFYLA